MATRGRSTLADRVGRRIKRSRGVYRRV